MTKKKPRAEGNRRRGDRIEVDAKNPTLRRPKTRTIPGKLGLDELRLLARLRR